MHTGHTPGWNHPLPARLHKPVFGALLAGIAVDLTRAGLGLEWPADWIWLGTAPWLLAALSLLVGLARRLPLQNVAFAAVGVLVGAAAVELLNARTGLPLGWRRADVGAGGALARMPWFAPWLWLTLLLAARGLARLALKPHRKLQFYGFWVMGLTTLLVLLAVLVVAPVAQIAGWWRAEATDRWWSWGWYHQPWLTLPAWGVTSLLLLAFSTPWLLNKQPVKQPTDLHPLAIWVALLSWLLGRQVIAGLWPAAVGSGLILGFSLLLVRHGVGRWK
jgi:hypothetical protein